MALNCSTGLASAHCLKAKSGRPRVLQPYRARTAFLFNRNSLLPIFVPAAFCASVGVERNAERHVLSSSNVSKLSRIAVTTLAITLVLTRNADIEISFQERD